MAVDWTIIGRALKIDSMTPFTIPDGIVVQVFKEGSSGSLGSSGITDSNGSFSITLNKLQFQIPPSLVIKVLDSQNRILYTSAPFIIPFNEDNHNIGSFIVNRMPIPTTWNIHGIVFQQDKQTPFYPGMIYVYGLNNQWLGETGINSDGSFTLTFARDTFQNGNVNIEAPEVIITVRNNSYQMLWQSNPFVVPSSEYYINPVIGTNGDIVPNIPVVPDNWSVFGNVLEEGGNVPSVQITVKAFDVLYGVYSLLGETVLDANGTYTINYNKSAFQKGDTGRTKPNLIVKVYSADGSLIDKSGQHDNALVNQEIEDIIIPPAITPPVDNWSVFGNVLEEGGNIPSVQITVKAFDVLYGVYSLLGETVLGANGEYTINYNKEAFQKGDTSRTKPNLIVKVYSADSSLIAESEQYDNALVNQEIEDIIIPQVITPPVDKWSVSGVVRDINSVPVPYVTVRAYDSVPAEDSTNKDVQLGLEVLTDINGAYYIEYFGSDFSGREAPDLYVKVYSGDEELIICSEVTGQPTPRDAIINVNFTEELPIRRVEGIIYDKRLLPPSPPVTVKAYELLPSGEDFALGNEVKTNAEGAYIIEYIKKYDIGEELPALYVKVFDENGKELGRSEFVKQAELPDSTKIYVKLIAENWNLSGKITSNSDSSNSIDNSDIEASYVYVWDLFEGKEYPIGSCNLAKGNPQQYSLDFKKEDFQRENLTREKPDLLVRIYNSGGVMVGYGKPTLIHENSENYICDCELQEEDFTELFSVSGQVSNTLGYPVSDCVVIVKNVLLFGGAFIEVELGRIEPLEENTLNASKGVYEISFYPKLVENLVLDSARFVIEVYTVQEINKQSKPFGPLDFAGKSNLLKATDKELKADFVIESSSNADVSTYTYIRDSLLNNGFRKDDVAATDAIIELALDDSKLEYAVELTNEPKSEILNFALAEFILSVLKDKLSSYYNKETSKEDEDSNADETSNEELDEVSNEELEENSNEEIDDVNSEVPNKVDSKVMYALVKTGNAICFEDLLKITADRLQTVLISAITQSIIPPDVQDDLSAIVEEWLLIYYILLTKDTKKSNAGQIFEYAIPKGSNYYDHYSTVVDVYSKNAHDLEKFWIELETELIAKLQEEDTTLIDGLINRLKFFFDIHLFADEFKPLSKAMMEYVDENTYADKNSFTALEDFVKLEKTVENCNFECKECKLKKIGWDCIIRKIPDFTYADEFTEWPELVPGESDTEKRKNYAAILYKRIIELFPMERFIFELNKADLNDEDELWLEVKRFLNIKPMFNLAENFTEEDFYDAVTDTYIFNSEDKIKDEEDTRALYGKLLIVQRIYRLNPKFKVVEALIKEGFTSAMAIAHKNCDEFTKQYSELLGGIDDSQALHAAAVHTASQALFLMGTFNRQTDLPEAIPAVTENFNNGEGQDDQESQETQNAPENKMPVTTLKANVSVHLENVAVHSNKVEVRQPIVPDITTLFGTQNQAFCEGYRSVFSPSAYMVDLLEFLNDDVRNELLNRRRDLFETDFSRNNTEGAVAYIDLVNEVLEEAVCERFFVLDYSKKGEDIDSKEFFQKLKNKSTAVNIKEFITEFLIDRYEYKELSEEELKELKEKELKIINNLADKFGKLGFYIDKEFYTQIIKDVSDKFYITGNGWKYLVSSEKYEAESNKYDITPFPQTGNDDQLRRTKPEHTHWGAYNKLKDTNYNTNLPFNLPFIEVNEFLKLKKTNRYELYNAFMNQNEIFVKNDDERDYKPDMLAFFEMTSKQKGLVTKPTEEEICELWGLLPGSDLSSLNNAEAVMKQLNISIEQFLDLMRTYFVCLPASNTNLFLEWDKEDPLAYEKGELDKLRIKKINEKNEDTSLELGDYSRMVRLQKLSNYLELDVITTDRLLLMACLLKVKKDGIFGDLYDDLKIDEAALINLFKFMKVAEEFSVSPIRAASWLCGWIENFNLGCKSQSQFEELFLSNIDTPERATIWKEMLNDTADSSERYFKTGGSTNDEDIATLLKGLNINYQDLAIIAKNELGTDLIISKFSLNSKNLTIANLAKMFRVADFSRVLGISVVDFYKLKSICSSTYFSPKFLIECRSVLAKLKKFKISLGEFLYLISGENADEISWLTAKEDLEDVELESVIKIHDEIIKTKTAYAENLLYLPKAIEETVLNQIAAIYKIDVDICRTVLEKVLNVGSKKSLLEHLIDICSGYDGWNVDFYGKENALIKNDIVPQVRIEAGSNVDYQKLPSPDVKKIEWSYVIAVPETTEYTITASAYIINVDENETETILDVGNIQVFVKETELIENTEETELIEEDEVQTLENKNNTPIDKTFEKGKKYSIVVEWTAPDDTEIVENEIDLKKINISCVWNKTNAEPQTEPKTEPYFIGPNVLLEADCCLNEIANVAYLIRTLKIKVDELDFLINHPNAIYMYHFNGLNFNDLGKSYSSGSLLSLLDIYILNSELPFKNKTFTIFKLLQKAQKPKTKQSLLSIIEREINWQKEDILELINEEFQIVVLKGIDSWSYINSVLKLLKKTGLNASFAEELISYADNSMEQSEALIGALKATYTKTEWIEVAEPIRNNIRRLQRDALCSYLLKNGEFANRAEIYAKYLIDVDMDTDVMTTRIVQANCSIQMFLQRALLNFESNIELDDKIKQQWHWMKNYRLWEANRKIFLYPENWIEPELRDDKTPLFKELESAVLQKELNPNNIQETFKSYVSGLSEISNLEVIGAYEEMGIGGKIMHIIGRTFHYPHSYYYRRNHDDGSGNGYWTPWEKVDLDITADVVLPVPFRNKIYIFWPVVELKEKAIEKKEDDDSKKKDKKDETQESQYEDSLKYFEVKLAWSEFYEGKWSAKRLSQNSCMHIMEHVNMDLIKHTDVFHFKAVAGQDNIDIQVFAYNKTVEQFTTKILVTKYKNVRGWFGIKHKVKIQEYQDVINEVEKEGIYRIAQFSFGADNNAKLIPVEDERNYMNSGMIPAGTLMCHNRAEESEDNQNSGNFGALEYPPKNVLLKRTPELFTCFSTNLSFFEDVPKPFFLKLNEKTLFVKPVPPPRIVSIRRLLASVSKAVRRTSWWSNKIGLDSDNKTYYKIDNFYHPMADDLVRRVNLNSVDDLLNRSVQANAKDQYPLGYAAVGDEHARHLADLSFKYNYLPQDTIIGGYPVPINDFALDSTFGIYNWELFFHLPMYIATRLSHDKQHEEAMRWFHYIFNPACNLTTWEKSQRWTWDLPEGAKYWNFLPFFANRGVKDSIYKAVEESQIKDQDTKLGCLMEAWKNDPFKPHLIARVRTAAYQKAVVMKYLDNLIEWGDGLFRLDNMESVNEATQLYVQASQILGDRPILVPKLYEMPSLTYNQLKAEGLDQFGNTVIQLENYITPPPATKVRLWRAKQAPSRYYYYHYAYNYNYTYNSSVEAVPHRSVQLLRMAPAMHYFGIPRNEKLITYWDTVEDRLFKIHNSLNIDGVKRVLPLFAPPIDPGMLVKAAAMGISVGALLKSIQSAPTVYRFTTVFQKAVELCNELKSFGTELTTALEKKDAEALTLLRNNQEIDLLNLIKDVKKKAVEESNQNLEALLKTKEITEERYNYYKEIERTSEGETLQLASSATAGFVHAVGQVMTIGAGAIQTIPDFYAGALVGMGGGPLAFSHVSGGSKASNSLSKAANALIQSASIADRIAGVSGIKASYDRRWNEWKLQEKLAQKELTQIDKQILSAQIRLEIAEKDLRNHEKQIEQSEELKMVMESKFLNEDTYQWMADELNKSYNSMYDIAYSAAKKAESAFKFELGSNENFITPEVWESTKKGLLAGNRLSVQLRQMDAAYIEKNKREIEITKAVSLNMLKPCELLKLRGTGSCSFELPEHIFDFDCPGHYFRRIKAVRITIPCVAGPYTNINAKLTLNDSRVRVNTSIKDSEYKENGTGNDSKFLYNPIPPASISTSGAMMDSGMFDFNFRDERYLPFEGAGAISSWSLELPNDYRQFDYNTITDVILHVSYTARESTFVPFKESVIQHLGSYLEGEESFPNIISLKQSFYGEFEAILNNKAVEITLNEKEHFPHLIVDYCKRNEKSINTSDSKIYVLLKDGKLSDGIEISDSENYTWNLNTLNPSYYTEVIEDILLYFNYSITQ